MRRNKIPRGYMCAVIGCIRFDTSMVKLGDQTAWLCKKHRSEDSLIIMLYGTLVRVNKIKRDQYGSE